MKNTNVDIASQKSEFLQQMMGYPEHPQVIQCWRDGRNEPCNVA
jgi:hypothetical protein